MAPRISGELRRLATAPDTPVHACGPEGMRQTVTLGELLPYGFGPANLES